MPISGLASGKLTAPLSSQQFNPTCQAHCADPPSIGGKMTGAGRLPLDVVAAGVVVLVVAVVAVVVAVVDTGVGLGVGEGGEGGLPSAHLKRPSLMR